eukprot:SAG31_NODE_327_length_17650_cov_18.626574_13_plen_266_part_00
MDHPHIESSAVRQGRAFLFAFGWSSPTFKQPHCFTHCAKHLHASGPISAGSVLIPNPLANRLFNYRWVWWILTRWQIHICHRLCETCGCQHCDARMPETAKCPGSIVADCDVIVSKKYLNTMCAYIRCKWLCWMSAQWTAASARHRIPSLRLTGKHTPRCHQRHGQPHGCCHKAPYHCKKVKEKLLEQTHRQPSAKGNPDKLKRMKSSVKPDSKPDDPHHHDPGIRQQPAFISRASARRARDAREDRARARSVITLLRAGMYGRT